MNASANDGLMSCSCSRPHRQLTRSGNPEARQECPASRVKSGKTMVVIGFVICIVGILAYCAVTLGAGQIAGSVLINSSLAIVATGFLCWLIGAIRYFNAAIDLGDDTETLF